MTEHIEACQAILQDLRAAKLEQIALEKEAAQITQDAGASKTEYLTSPEYLDIVGRNYDIGLHIDRLQVQLEYHTGMVSLEVAVATIKHYTGNGLNIPNQHEALPPEGYIIESKG